MELPDDVLQLIREYAKPSEPYKMYARVLKILLNKVPSGIREFMIPKLNRATRFHYERFLPLFLKLAKRHNELVLSVHAVSANDTSIYTVSDLQKEYNRTLKNFTSINCDVLTELNKL
jgi:hypothetical protein